LSFLPLWRDRCAPIAAVWFLRFIVRPAVVLGPGYLTWRMVTHSIDHRSLMVFGAASLCLKVGSDRKLTLARVPDENAGELRQRAEAGTLGELVEREIKDRKIGETGKPWTASRSRRSPGSPAHRTGPSTTRSGARSGPDRNWETRRHRQWYVGA
jgi:hypothetical protein